jgi:trehalose 6-phosphate synthase/phosphatase
MNLVAQEFALCQSAAEPPAGRHGTLLLSEFAGAAQVLPGALLVNPWDAGDLAGRLLQALALEEAERSRRIELMADRVAQLDSSNWGAAFLARLERFAAQPKPHFPERLDEARAAQIAQTLADARRRTFLFDYDGTLREIVPHPMLAAPTAELRELLVRLASLPRTDVHVVSGRTRESLDAWLGELPVSLCAEHGAFAREPGGPWRSIVDADLSWLRIAEELLLRTAEEVPGSAVERKSSSVAWHYREAEPEYGQWRAHELLAALSQSLSGLPAEVLAGHRVIEIRARGVNKGAYMRHLESASTDAAGWSILAAGDDLTDDDLFAALPDGSIAIHVGPPRPRGRDGSGHTQLSVDSPAALRRALVALADGLSDSEADAQGAGTGRARPAPAGAAG